MSQQQAQAFLENWRETCAQRRFREANLRITFSGGISTKGNMSVEEALALADKLLYQAKHDGKNQIISAPLQHG